MCRKIWITGNFTTFFKTALLNILNPALKADYDIQKAHSRRAVRKSSKWGCANFDWHKQKLSLRNHPARIEFDHSKANPEIPTEALEMSASPQNG